MLNSLYHTCVGFLILSLFFLLTDDFRIFAEIQIMIKKGRIPSVLFYLFTYFFCAYALVLLLKSSKPLLATAAYVFLWTGIVIDYGYRDLNGLGFGYEDALLIFQNAGFGFEQDILKAYGAIILKAVLTGSVFTLIVGIWSKFNKSGSVNLIKAGLLFLAGLCFCHGIMKYSVLRRTAFPAPFKVASLFFNASIFDLYSGDRALPYFTPKTSPEVPHVVWIIDESVRGDFLQINGYEKETTPFLDSIYNDHIINYGVASSGAICSDYSHIMLMNGFQLSDLPDYEGLNRERPTIFQYAEQVGMSSNLIYGPGYDLLPKSYMTKSDYEIIDNKQFTKLSYPNLLNYEIDLFSIRFLDTIVQQSSQSFTYFLKYGVHTHYEYTYPREARYFEPVMQSTDFFSVEKESLHNSYSNGIRWEVDHFFSELHRKFENEDIIFIYTSDHGQNLLDDPKIKLSHCIKENAPYQMAAVPLFIYATQKETKMKLSSEVIPANLNCASHFNIFSSTLKIMGYDKTNVEAHYGKNLNDELCEDQRQFTYGDIFGRGTFGVKEFPKVN